MGTPDFAVGVLQKLVRSKYQIVGVITAPDKPAGRGRKLKPSAVKEYALSHQLPLLQPTNLKEDSFLEQLKNLNANLQIVVAFRMLPKSVWKLPSYGTFNLHASLLPQYRGAAPINWAIINREKITGVTTFFIDDAIDTGNIILKEEIPIHDRSTIGSLYDTLMNSGADLVLETVALIEQGKEAPIQQSNLENLKMAPKLNKENTRIDWSANVEDIDALIRGLDPYPAAWSQLFNRNEIGTVKIYRCDFNIEKHSFAVGHLIATKDELKVAAKNGLLSIHEIQIPGKRKMNVKALLNGYVFDENSKML